MNAGAYRNKALPRLVFQKAIMNHQNLVSELLNEISQWLKRAKVKSEQITDVQIVLAEVLNNVIKHGYANQGAGAIDVMINISDGSIMAEIFDNGVAFTPPDVKQTPLKDCTDFEALPEGGFGWFLIGEVTKSYQFHRINNKNHLVLNFA